MSRIVFFQTDLAGLVLRGLLFAQWSRLKIASNQSEEESRYIGLYFGMICDRAQWYPYPSVNQ